MPLADVAAVAPWATAREVCARQLLTAPATLISGQACSAEDLDAMPARTCTGQLGIGAQVVVAPAGTVPLVASAGQTGSGGQTSTPLGPVASGADESGHAIGPQPVVVLVVVESAGQGNGEQAVVVPVAPIALPGHGVGGQVVLTPVTPLGAVPGDTMQGSGGQVVVTPVTPLGAVPGDAMQGPGGQVVAVPVEISGQARGGPQSLVAPPVAAPLGPVVVETHGTMQAGEPVPTECFRPW